jgi:hypothetical protein
MQSQPIITVADPGELDRDELTGLLRRDSFACLRGIVSPGDIRRARASLQREFDPGGDNPTAGNHGNAVMGHYQKLNIGGDVTSRGQSRGYSAAVNPSRFYRTIYCPLDDDDRYGMDAVFYKACRIRNLIHGLPADFCMRRPEQGLWTAARIHHFPAGGGFLSAHKDKKLPKILLTRGLDEFYQLIIVLSRRGIDYEKGGPFIENTGGRIFYEEFCEPGDIVLFDGTATVHGVVDIDPQKVLDLTTLSGRLSGFVTLYVLPDQLNLEPASSVRACV